MYIYKTTCLINGKIYIGQCSLLPEKSEKYLGSGVSLLLAIKKYGTSNFKKEILKRDIETQILLDVFEQIYIKINNSTNKEIGYNIIEGAANFIGQANPAKLPHAREAIIAANKRRIVTDEQKRKIGDANRGRKFTEEHKKKIGEKHKNKVVSRETIERQLQTKKDHGVSYKGENNPMYGIGGMKGKKHSEETKRKMREASLRRKLALQENKIYNGDNI